MISKAQRELRQHWIGLSRRRTADGWEKLCPGCIEWLPHDSEFFQFVATRGHYHSHCKMCRAESRRVA